jgi:hypothetical protein
MAIWKVRAIFFSQKPFECVKFMLLRFFKSKEIPPKKTLGRSREPREVRQGARTTDISASVAFYIR